MDPLDHAADHCIRRALGFTGFGIATVMLALSYDMALALRSGGDLMAIAAVVLLGTAWRARHTDLRDSETWALFNAMRPELVAGLAKGEAQRLLAATLRRRLMWHAERVGAGALALWALMGLLLLLRGVGAVLVP